MKTWNVIVKIGVALLTVAGAIVVIAKYGDKIVTWCKELFKKAAPVEVEAEEAAVEAAEESAEESAAEVAEEAPAEAAEEAPAEENTADEADFEG